jgi:hypothetical protein
MADTPKGWRFKPPFVYVKAVKGGFEIEEE